MAEIADELRAKLRDEWLRKATSSFTCQECGIQANFIDEIINALDAKEAGGWQPIETAPTNRAILIHLPGLDYYGNDGVYAGMLVDMGTGRRWMTFGWAIGRDVAPENQPDAWMPMPFVRPNKEDRNG